jgi:hypothetical protein
VSKEDYKTFYIDNLDVSYELPTTPADAAYTKSDSHSSAWQVYIAPPPTKVVVPLKEKPEPQVKSKLEVLLDELDVTMWGLDDALTLIRGLQPKVRQFNYHVALGGGVLNTGMSFKDLDIYFLPLDGEASNPLRLLQWLQTQWGDATDLSGEEYMESSSYTKKVKFVLKDGRRIDAFIV